MANRRINISKLLVQVINSANDIIIITEASPLDEPGPRIVYVNKAFETLTGYTQKEVIGLTPRILQGPKTSSKTIHKIRRILEKKANVDEMILNYTKNGREYWLDMKIVPLYDENHQVTHFAAIERDVTRLKKLEKKLTRMATEDPLTKTLNRRAFYKIANHFFDDFEINKTEFSIMLLDIDDFKRINDKYGHLVGDETLRWLTSNIKHLLRKSDLFARYGGEEFIMLLPGANLEESRKLAHKINYFFKINPFYYSEAISPTITVSIGVACISGKDHSFEQLINRTDKLLYKAKRANKNCVMG